MLTGAVNPSGRLAETIPHRLEDNSSYLNFPGDSQVVRYGEGLFIGYRGYDKAHQDVAFPFGFGLSYTSFALSDLTVDDPGLGGRWHPGRHGHGHGRPTPAPLTVPRSCRSTCRTWSRPWPVRCASSRASPRSRSRPDRPQTVSIELDQRAFAFWSVQQGGWAVEAGDFVIGVGPNSRDLPLTQTITVEAPRLAGPLSRDSTLHEWMNDPIGRQLIEREVANGQPAAAMDEELLARDRDDADEHPGQLRRHESRPRRARPGRRSSGSKKRNPLEPDWKHQAMSVCVAVTDSKEGQAALEAAATRRSS